ncbi:MAG: hypothetical protein OEY85_15365 [Rhodospirillales bacterium]|nr:hypothetical protein [Rhodospirillales bacterium]
MKGLSGGRDWAHFVAWSRARGLRVLPAHPWTVAAYLRWCEPRLNSTQIGNKLKAISRRHFINKLKSPVHHPTVSRTLHLIERRARTRGDRAALFSPEDFLNNTPDTAKEDTGGENTVDKDVEKEGEESRRKAAGRLFSTTPRLKPRRPKS